MQMTQDAGLPRLGRGFTLIETLVVVAVLALITVMAKPSFVAWRMRDQVDARARALLSTLSYARSEAVKRGVRVTVCRVDAARHCLAADSALTLCTRAVLSGTAPIVSVIPAPPAMPGVSAEPSGWKLEPTFSAGAFTPLAQWPGSIVAPQCLVEAWQLSTRPDAKAFLLTARGFGRTRESQAWLQLELVVDGERIERHWRRVAARPF
jgi:prepilin-type N-terminal cleavage/methylation domain-containing protein